MNIPYSDSRIYRSGRWQDTGIGIWSGFPSSELRFNVSGSTSITINANVICSLAKSCFCGLVIDNDWNAADFKYFANNENFSGARSVIYNLPDTGEHSIILKGATLPADQFSGASKVTITSITLDNGAAVSSSDIGEKLIQVVGDSWVGFTNDWARLMDENLWNVYSIGTGGFKASDMNSQYNYMSTGVSAIDPVADAVVIEYSINEYNISVSVATFQTNLLALVDKVRAKQSCPIFLPQLPRNMNTGDTFDQYGIAMQNIAGMRSGVYYIPSLTIWTALTWVDNYHLDAPGKKIWASFINESIKNNLWFTRPFIRIHEEQIKSDLIITDTHPYRIHSAMNVGFSELPNSVRIKN